MMLMAGTAIRDPAALSTQRRVGRGGGDRKMVAIVGAGFSGTMAAIHRRHALPPEWVVVLFARTGRFARGPAYVGTTSLASIRRCGSHLRWPRACPPRCGAWRTWWR